MLSNPFPQIASAAHVEVPVLLALQYVDVIHVYFTGFEGAETAARLNCKLRA